MLGVTGSPAVRGKMKRSTANGEEAPQAKRKKIQAENLDSTLVRLQTVAQDQEPAIERPQSTQVEKVLNKAWGGILFHFFLTQQGLAYLRSLPVFGCDIR